MFPAPGNRYLIDRKTILSKIFSRGVKAAVKSFPIAFIQQCCSLFSTSIDHNTDFFLTCLGRIYETKAFVKDPHKARPSPPERKAHVTQQQSTEREP